ncbi:hypothetical protein J7L13_03295 [bacterium]|nr:hypothetical protein [bacterium]
MVKVKPLEEIAKRYAESASFVPERYARGIQTVNDWQSRATSDEAEELWKAKLQEAIAAERRKKALAHVSNEEWKSKALKLGKNRIGEGIRNAADKQKKGFAPYHEALSSLELPPKTVDPMANIDNRLKKVVETLVNKKKEIKG